MSDSANGEVCVLMLCSHVTRSLAWLQYSDHRITVQTVHYLNRTDPLL